MCEMLSELPDAMAAVIRSYCTCCVAGRSGDERRRTRRQMRRECCYGALDGIEPPTPGAPLAGGEATLVEMNKGRGRYS